MYNLFVSAMDDAWNGDPWVMDRSRCVREYTDDDIIERFGSLDADAIAELQKLPCIFAYEAYNKIDPKFGVIKDVTVRQKQVRVEYELMELENFLTADDLGKMEFELDIGGWEMNRTHWAVKKVDLAKELHRKGISLPGWTRGIGRTVDITKHVFDVAFSFPGEVRGVVEEVAKNLEAILGPHTYFYDFNYTSQLARPSLDVLLQDIYRHRSRLIVVFLSADYQRKNWCGIEFRAIRDIIAERGHTKIMFVRTDDGAVEGVFATDGYVDARHHSSAAIAQFIAERVALL